MSVVEARGWDRAAGRSGMVGCDDEATAVDVVVVEGAADDTGDDDDANEGVDAAAAAATAAPPLRSQGFGGEPIFCCRLLWRRGKKVKWSSTMMRGRREEEGGERGEAGEITRERVAG